MVEEGIPVPPIRESPPAFIPHSSNRQDELAQFRLELV